MRCLPVLALALPLAVAAVAAVDELPSEAQWERTNRRALDHYEAGRYTEALAEASANMPVAEKLFSRTHPRMVRTLANLGMMYHALARFAEAEPLMRDAVARATESGRVDRDLAVFTNNLADCLSARGKLQESVELYERAIDTSRSIGLAGTPQHALFLDNLGQTLLALAEPGKALVLIQEALAIQTRHLPADHPELAETVGHLAALHVRRGDFVRAEEYLTRLIDITRAAKGRGHPAVAQAMKDLAHAYVLQGNHKEAFHLMHHALDIAEAAFGRDDPNTAPFLEEAGRARLVAGENREAEGYFARALAAYEKTGPETPTAASMADNLATAELQLGKLAEAEMHASRAVAIVEKTLPPGHPLHLTVQSTLGAVLFRAAKYPEAERVQRRLVELLVAQGGREEILDAVYENLAGTLRKLGREKEAEEVERKRIGLAWRGQPSY